RYKERLQPRQKDEAVAKPPVATASAVAATLAGAAMTSPRSADACDNSGGPCGRRHRRGYSVKCTLSM
ncbi:hypothetical protein, partial [Xanthomonas graminis]|uniref:hypothetical protein n=1 Tax=Xanthomonas graminis TaxID=3390026 RepID=UPI001BAFFA8C